MKQICTLFVLLFFVLSQLHAQNKEDYPLISQGKLPKDFVIRSSTKYEIDKANLKKKEKDKKAKQSFLLASNFEIDKLLLSGKVLFNDALSSYVNKVADKLLENDRPLRNKLRFYIFKSSAVNAFATNQGMIFINVGLLAHIHSEAELAMVLSHEIQHYLSKHSMKIAVVEDKIKKGKGAYKKLESKQDKTLARCFYSKEQEAEADLKGFTLLKKSGYAYDSVLPIFEVLKYSHLPFENRAFSKTLFETNFFKLPQEYFDTEILPIDSTDDFDDKKSSHPALPKRTKAIQEEIAKTGNANGKRVYLVGREAFDQAQKIARFEETNLLMLDHEYERCIYNAYLLSEKYPNELFLQKMILHSLTALGAYSANGKFYDIHTYKEKVEGNVKTLFDLFLKMNSSARFETSVLALAYGAKLMKENPNDEDIVADMRAITKALHLQEIDLSYFNDAKTKRDFSKPKVVQKNEEEAEDEDDSKKTKSKKSTEKMLYLSPTGNEKRPEDETKKNEDSYMRTAVINYRNESWLATLFAKAYEEDSKADTAENEDEYIGRKKSNKQTQALGLDKILVINPQFQRINDEMSDPIRYLRSERGQVDFTERVKDNAKVAKIETELLDSRDLTEADVKKLNDIALLQDYLRDQNAHANIGVPFPYRSKIRALMQKYDCSNVLWTGVISHQERFRGRTGLAIGSALFPPMLPFTLSKIVNKGYWTYYFNLVYDLEKDEAVFGNFREINNRTAGYILNSHIYDTFYQLKHK